MIFKINFSKIVHGVLNTEPSHYDKRTIHPTREWLFGLLVFFVIVGVGGTVSLQTLALYQNLKTNEGTSEEKVPSYNSVLIERVINTYRIRKNVFVTLSEASTQYSEELEQFKNATWSDASADAPDDNIGTSQIVPVAN